jgi:hypothetical protein
MVSKFGVVLTLVLMYKDFVIKQQNAVRLIAILNSTLALKVYSRIFLEILRLHAWCGYCFLVAVYTKIQVWMLTSCFENTWIANAKRRTEDQPALKMERIFTYLSSKTTPFIWCCSFLILEFGFNSLMRRLNPFEKHLHLKEKLKKHK